MGKPKQEVMNVATKEIDNVEFKKRLGAGKFADKAKALKALAKVSEGWEPNAVRGVKIAISRKFGKEA